MDVDITSPIRMQDRLPHDISSSRVRQRCPTKETLCGEPGTVVLAEVITASDPLVTRSACRSSPLKALGGADAIVAGVMLQLGPPEQFEHGGDVVGEAAAVALA